MCGQRATGVWLFVFYLFHRYAYVRELFLAWVKTAKFLIWCARMMTARPEKTLVTLVKFARNRPTSIKAAMLTNFNIEKQLN